jgi:hypothetical protein
VFYAFPSSISKPFWFELFRDLSISRVVNQTPDSFQKNTIRGRRFDSRSVNKLPLLVLQRIVKMRHQQTISPVSGL